MEPHERARERARRRSSARAPWRRPQPADLLVNCTSVGLCVERSATEDRGLNQLGLRGDQIGEYSHVADLVYRSKPTPLLAAAEAGGAHDGRRPRDPRRAGRAQLRDLDRSRAARRGHARAPRATADDRAAGAGRRRDERRPQPAGPDLHAIFGIEGEQRDRRARDLGRAPPRRAPRRAGSSPCGERPQRRLDAAREAGGPSRRRRRAPSPTQRGLAAEEPASATGASPPAARR